MGWEYTNFHRDELYEQVWSEAVSKVATRYGVSDVGLRKICVSLEIPLPPRGYWARLAAGQRVKKPPLLPTKGPTTHRRSRYSVPQDELLDARYREGLESDSAHRPAVPSVPLRTSLEDCLPLTKRIATRLAGKGRDPRVWPLCDGAGLMWVESSSVNSLRAVLLLNLMLESLVATGYRISTNAKTDGRAFVSILDFKFSFKVRERSRREAIPLTREQRQENEKLGFNRYSQLYEYHPTGEFDIAATEPNNRNELAKIGDSRTASVESKVVAFKLQELDVEHACA